MNPKMQSIAQLSKDKCKKQKEFIQNQSFLNKKVKKKHKDKNYFNEAQDVIGLSRIKILTPKKVIFCNSERRNSYNQSKILQDQIKLHDIESQYDLQLSRIEDQNNLKTYKTKYPYGKQNVKITQDVLEKYRANNYQHQAETIKKFQDQAKKNRDKFVKKNLKDSYSPSFQNSNIDKGIQKKCNFVQRTIYINKKSSILEKQKEELYKAKIKYLKQKQKLILKKIVQNTQFQKIENILKQMKLKIKQNKDQFYNDDLVAKLIREEQIKKLEYSRSRLKKVNILNLQQYKTRQKIPIVIYNLKNDKNCNFLAKHFATGIMSLERNKGVQLQKPEQYDQIKKIQKLNKLRLDQLSERTSVRENISNCLF